MDTTSPPSRTLRSRWRSARSVLIFYEPYVAGTGPGPAQPGRLRIGKVESRSGAVVETPFPLPAHRTGRAVFRHPALGQELMPSPTESSWEGRSSESGPARRAGTGRGTVTSRDSSACASPGAIDGAGAARGGLRLGTRR